MVVALPAHAVETMLVREAIIGLTLEHPGIVPPLEMSLSVRREHEVDHLLAKEEHRVGICGEGGILAHIAEHVEHLVLLAGDYHLVKLCGVLGQEYGVGGKRLGQAQLLVAYDADGDGVVSSVDTGRLAQVAALANEMALAIEHGGSRQRRPANRVNHYVPAY